MAKHLATHFLHPRTVLMSLRSSQSDTPTHYTPHCVLKDCAKILTANSTREQTSADVLLPVLQSQTFRQPSLSPLHPIQSRWHEHYRQRMIFPGLVLARHIQKRPVTPTTHLYCSNSANILSSLRNHESFEGYPVRLVACNGLVQDKADVRHSGHTTSLLSSQYVNTDMSICDAESINTSASPV